MKKFLQSQTVDPVFRPVVILAVLFLLGAVACSDSPVEESSDAASPPAACEPPWDTHAEAGVSYCLHMTATNEPCPKSHPERTVPDASNAVVVCDDTPGGDQKAIDVAHTFYRERCAEFSREEDCECLWVSAARHYFSGENSCEQADFGICIFASQEYGDEELCVERETPRGSEALTLSQGYGVVPGWEFVPLNICRECQ